MSENITKRISNLLCIKSIVTLVLTAVFAYLSITGTISGQEFLTVLLNFQKLILNNMTISDSGYNNGLWNRYDHVEITNFACDVELNDAKKATLSVENAAFTTSSKAAILVKSPAGADITASNVNIANVAADSTNLVWVDEDGAASFGAVIVTGGTVTGTTAIHLKSGSIEVTSGKLVATGAAADYVFNPNGSNSTGDALVLENIGGSTGYEEISSVVISGGIFESANGDPIGSYAADGTEALAGFISGGEFSKTVAQALCVLGILTYTDEQIESVYGSNQAFYAYITNYANYTAKNLHIQVKVVSELGVEIATELHTITI